MPPLPTLREAQHRWYEAYATAMYRKGELDRRTYAQRNCPSPSGQVLVDISRDRLADARLELKRCQSVLDQINYARRADAAAAAARAREDAEAKARPKINEKPKSGFRPDSPPKPDSKDSLPKPNSKDSPPKPNSKDSKPDSKDSKPKPKTLPGAKNTPRPRVKLNPTSAPSSTYRIFHWRAACDAAFANMAAVEKFPTPPVRECTVAACVAGKRTRAVKACGCNVAKVLEHAERLGLVRAGWKAERLRWHPDRWAVCKGDAEAKGGFQKMASEVFVVVNALWEKEKEEAKRR